MYHQLLNSSQSTVRNVVAKCSFISDPETGSYYKQLVLVVHNTNRERTAIKQLMMELQRAVRKKEEHDGAGAELEEQPLLQCTS
jgi:hypothetical protein